MSYYDAVASSPDIYGADTAISVDMSQCACADIPDVYRGTMSIII